MPEYGVPEYGVPEYGVPEYGVPEYGVPDLRKISKSGNSFRSFDRQYSSRKKHLHDKLPSEHFKGVACVVDSIFYFLVYSICYW